MRTEIDFQFPSDTNVLRQQMLILDYAKIILYFKQFALRLQNKHLIFKFYCSSLQTGLKKENYQTQC